MSSLAVMVGSRTFCSFQNKFTASGSRQGNIGCSNLVSQTTSSRVAVSQVSGKAQRHREVKAKLTEGTDGTHSAGRKKSAALNVPIDGKYTGYTAENGYTGENGFALSTDVKVEASRSGSEAQLLGLVDVQSHLGTYADASVVDDTSASDVYRLKTELLRTQLQLQEAESQLEAVKSRLQAIEGQDSLHHQTHTTLEDGDSRSGLRNEFGVMTESSELTARALEAPSADVKTRKHKGSVPGSKALKTTGRVEKYTQSLKSFWYPAAFSRDVDKTTLIPIECFEEPWVVFRDTDGKPGCIRDECAHRACPLSLGTVVDGRVACAYHGWEFSTSGLCEKMPSTKCTHARVPSLPCVERDGIIWIWPAADSRDAGPWSEDDLPNLDLIPDTMPPSNHVIHAELVMELPVEHGLLVENLLDLAHAPFTHTSTFAKGWSVPNMVRFKTAAAAALQGHWDPYPIAMEFRPPCVVVSTIGLAKPGQLEGGQTSEECSQHLFQMHACVPSSPGKTRLLYRMGLDFAGWVKYVPFINRLWSYLASQVLDEDLRLVIGQQDRMHRGGNVWNHPVLYDKLGVRYRRWRDAVEAGSKSPPK